MLEALGLHDGVRLFVDGNPGGDNEQELARLIASIREGTEDFESDKPSLPETESGVLDRILSSQEALLSILQDPDKIWESVPLAEFRKTGKYNCLRITPSGTVFLDIIKPDVHHRYSVNLADHISAE